jgi:hypothetical protein
MSKLRVHAFSISLDGYGAGSGQDLDNPLGKGGTAMHQWVYPTRTFQRIFGKDEGTTGIDDDCLLGYEVTEHVPSEKATHVVLSKRGE